MRKFDEVKPLERMAAEAALASDETEQICQALVSIAFYEQDWQWVQEKCLVLLSSKASAIRGLAATCLGHIARMHGQWDKERVMGALRERMRDPAIAGSIEDALDDIAMFLSGDWPPEPSMMHPQNPAQEAPPFLPAWTPCQSCLWTVLDGLQYKVCSIEHEAFCFKKSRSGVAYGIELWQLTKLLVISSVWV